MEPTVPNHPPARHPACPLPWCTNEHNSVGDVAHTALVADLDIDRATIEVVYRQEQVAGHLQPPTLRVLFGPDWAPSGTLDIPLPAAAALGDIIALLDIHSYTEFGAALVRGSKGPGQAGTVTW